MKAKKLGSIRRPLMALRSVISSPSKQIEESASTEYEGSKSKRLSILSVPNSSELVTGNTTML